MIGTISIECNAKNPNMPLWPLRAYVNSPSSLRLRNVPKKIGQWEITSVQVNVNYPDKTLKTAQCVLVGGVWVGTVEGSSATGSYTNGYTVLANGTDENGNPVSGYVLGRGDVEILKEDGTPIEDQTHFVTDDELEAAISSKAEISDVDDVANDLTDLSNSLSDYYLKTETSSATEIQTALDGKQPTGDYALSSQLPTKTSELSNDSGYITSAQVEPDRNYIGFSKSSHNALQIYNINNGVVYDNLNSLLLYNGQPVVEGEEYYPWQLTKWYSDTFATPLQLEFKYIGNIQVPLKPSMPIPISKTINQYGWIASSGQLTHYIIKAEHTIPTNPDYFEATAIGKFDAPSSNFMPITLSNNLKSVETVNGESGVVTCTRTGTYKTTNKTLAFRDELSAKADLSALNEVADSLSNYYTKSQTSSATEIQEALNNVSVDLSEYYTKNETSSNVEISTALNLKQDKLSDAQVSAIDSVVDERKTVVKYDDNSIVAYDIDGTLSVHDLDISGKNIIEVKIGNAVTAIGAHCFDRYKQLVNVYIPSSVATIDRYAFIECDSLTGLLIPESVTSIGDYAFYSCDNLTSELTIPDSVTNIGIEAFAASFCPKFVIGSGVTNIGANAFLGNGGRIKEMTFKGKTLAEVQSMTNYPWSIGDTSIIKTYNVASKEWVLEQLSALEARIAALENN